MDRVALKTPEKDVAALTSHVLQVFRDAVPNRAERPLFDHLVNEASANGLNWIEALEFAAACRRSLPVVDPLKVGVVKRGRSRQVKDR